MSDMREKRVASQRKNRKRACNGFTLVEMIVVLVILSIVSAVAVPSVLGYIDDGKAKKCNSQVSALAADIATEKLSFEVNGSGDDDGAEFGVAEINQYIANDAGDLGKCPAGGVYQAKLDAETSQIEISCSVHGNGTKIPNSGKFTVAVAAASPTPTPDSGTTTPDSDTTPDTSATPKEHSYTVTIEPNSLDVEVDESQELHVTVRDEDNNIIDPSRYTVQWSYSGGGNLDVPQGSQTGSSAFVTGKEEGRGQVSCTVTITEDGNTKQASASAEANVFKHQLNLEITPPEIQAGETGKKLGIQASYDNGEQYTGGYTFECDPDSGITIDPDGTIHADAPGTYNVTVSATDKYGDTVKETVTVTVTPKETEPEVSKEHSIFNPDTLRIWIDDVGDSFNVSLNEHLSNLPKGKWYYEGSERVEIHNENGNQDMQIWDSKHSGVFRFRFEADDRRTDWLTVYFGYPLASISQFSIHQAGTEAEANSVIKINDRLDCKAKLNPDWTSDVTPDKPLNWEIRPENAPVRIDRFNDDRHTSATLTATGEGKFSIRVYATREKDGEIREAVSREITIGEGNGGGQPQTENQNQSQSESQSKITGITLNPSSMTLKVGQSQQLTVELQTDGGEIDMDKVTYKFEPWGNIIEVTQQESKNAVNVTGVSAGTTGMNVTVFYDGQQVAFAQCNNSITVESSQGKITGATLNPSSMTLKVGQSQQLTVELQIDGGEIDMDKVTYKFEPWGNIIEVTQQESKNAVNVTGVSAGTTGMNVTVFYDGQQVAFAQCNNSIIVESSQGKITGVTLNLSSMTLKVGQSKQLEAVLQIDGGDIDMSKVTYSFQPWWDIIDVNPQERKNVVTVTGMRADTQTTGIGVTVNYDGQWAASAQCNPIAVEPLPANEVVIDGNCFGATSWEEFKKNVEATADNERDYKVNDGRDTENEDETVLFYDEIEEDGIKKRIYYMAPGNFANFSASKTPVEGLESFRDFLNTEGGDNKLFIVDFEHVIDINEEELENAPIKKNGYPNGTVARIKKASGEYEYYVVYDKGADKTQLNRIGKTKAEGSNWWKLKIFP